MKSSDAVFTKKNPFPPEPRRPRAHYSPSRTKKIPKQQKKLALSPVRFSPSASPPESPPKTVSLRPEDQHFLEGSHNVLLSPLPSITEQQNYSESWPSTDQSSSPASTDVQHPPDTVAQEPSVLAKYIERFRFGRPQSREERQRSAADGEDDQPFWWMSSNPSQPSSSTPTATSKDCFGGSFECRNAGRGSVQDLFRHQSESVFSPTRGLLDLSALALSDSSHCEHGELLQLQERTNRLLQRSEHSLSNGSTGLPISSEGLGCSDFSSPVSVVEPTRKPTIPSLIDAAHLMTPSGLLPSGPVGPQPRPENDILFQWRLRRKMEQARQWGHTSSHSSTRHQPLLSRLALQTQPGLSFTFAPMQMTGGANTPFSCPDPVLCSSSQVHPASGTDTKDESINQSSLVSALHCDREKIPKQLQTAHSVRLRGQQYSSPPPQPTESSERDGCQEKRGMQTISRAEGERSKKKSTQKKNSSRHVGDGDAGERNQHNVNARNKQRRGQERVGSKSKDDAEHRASTQSVRSRDSPSPVHNTLGQVVSEVLFPGTDSPIPSRTLCTTSPVRTPPASSPSHVSPPRDSSQPTEVIGQLMQEAQDSDGLEFADDPLLLVLRQQRKWVKEQLCEVDALLDKFHED